MLGEVDLKFELGWPGHWEGTETDLKEGQDGQAGWGGFSSEVGNLGRIWAEE